MHHPQSLDPLSVTALGSGLRTATARDDDSSPDDAWMSLASDDGPTNVDDASRVRRRAVLLAAVPELGPEVSPLVVSAMPAFRVVDVPTFFFFPFDHIAHQVAAEVHGLGAMRRVAVHTTGAPCSVTARTLVLSLSQVGTNAIASVEQERETRFSDLEALIVAIDAAIEWLGLDVRPPVELTLDIDFERDGEVDPNDVTLTVRTSRASSGGGIVAEVMLFHEITAEALVLRTRFDATKELPVYPAPKRFPPPSSPALAAAHATDAPTAIAPA